MKLLVVAVVTSLAAVVSGSYVPSAGKEIIADKEFLIKQKFIFEIMRNIHMPIQYEEYIIHSKNIIEDITKYKDPKIIIEAINMINKGIFIGKGDIFTIYNKDMLKQTYIIFSILINSIDWDTCYKNIIWARQNINEGMFIYAITMTILHRPDMQGIIMPAIYEIYPYYFFNTDIIRTASIRKMYDPKFGFYGNGKYNVVYSNFTMTYPKEYKDGIIIDDIIGMNYYNEDIGLNSYYFYFMMDYPFFIGADKFGIIKPRSGEIYMYIHQQLIARYNLERLSNMIEPIKMITWRFPLKIGYFSMLSYYNGIPFKSRDINYIIKDDDYIKLDMIIDWETRIRRIIDDGYIISDDGIKIDLRKPENIDIIGKIINCNIDSIICQKYGFIEMISKMIISGIDFITKKTWPSVIMQYETTLRDPIIYSIWERIISFYYQFKSYLPIYTIDDLSFKGIIIKDVIIDKLMTYFEYFDSEISNAIPIKTIDKYWDFSIIGRTIRINHKPFNYKIEIASEIAGKGIIRAFIGPKIDNIIDIDIYRKYFIEIDQNIIDITIGKNTIIRNSHDFFWSIKDRTSYIDLYKKIIMGIDGKEKFILDMSEAHCGFPDRLIIPKGRIGGMKMQIYFIITPYIINESQTDIIDKGIICNRIIDNKPMGFPFDRPINIIDIDWNIIKNMIFKDIIIYHADDIKKKKSN